MCDRFNPDYAKYGFGSWPGGIAHNAFNNSEVEPYTGRLNISDYIEDLQVPQLLDIALKYDTEIMVRSLFSQDRDQALVFLRMTSGVTSGAPIGP
jgi:hypothetical protein